MRKIEITYTPPWVTFFRKYGLWGTVLIVLSILCVISGLIVTIYFFKHLHAQFEIISDGGKLDLGASGSTGDFIGGLVGTIWSLAGVFLFFLALRLQSKELGLQIQELKETKKVFITQQFENTFFNLLKVQQEIRNGLLESFNNLNEHPEADQDDLLELNFFEVLANELISMYNQITEIVSKKNQSNAQIIKKIQKIMESEEIDRIELIDTEEKRARAAYYIVFNDYHNQLSHYFRHLYHILDFIEQKEEMEVMSEALTRYKGGYEEAKLNINGMSSEEELIRIRYGKFINLIQAQMSSTELLLMFYNGICFKKLKKLILKYNFLENLSENDLLNTEHKAFYADQTIDGEKYSGVNFKNKAKILQQNLK